MDYLMRISPMNIQGGSILILKEVIYQLILSIKIYFILAKIYSTCKIGYSYLHWD